MNGFDWLAPFDALLCERYPRWCTTCGRRAERAELRATATWVLVAGRCLACMAQDPEGHTLDAICRTRFGQEEHP